MKSTLKADKEKIVAAYHNRHKALFAYSSNGVVTDKDGILIRAQNSWAAAFWAGVDGLTRGPRVPTRSMMSYPFYAAGKVIRKKSEGIT